MARFLSAPGSDRPLAPVATAGDVVDRDDVDAVGIEQNPERRSPDPTQTVDSHGRHVS
jgi:hypothetical protein